MTRTSRGAGNEVSTLDGQTLPGSLVDYVEHSEALGAVQRVMHEVERPLVIGPGYLSEAEPMASWGARAWCGAAN